ncbi:MAG: redox-sensing transcriptional repressor Rex, partial [Enterococcus aquimarinus]|nr:redox-sensing transcriptional repressor Rex [Enterococcus aquimarinus]
IGTVFEGYYIHSMDELAEKVAENGLTVAITTVPSHHSQEAVDVIVESGITAILNFAPDRVTVPDEVNVRYIDLTTELLTLIFFDNQNHYKMPAVHFNEQ